MPRLPLLHRLMPQRSDPDAANGQNAAVTAPQPKPRRRADAACRGAPPRAPGAPPFARGTASRSRRNRARDVPARPLPRGSRSRALRGADRAGGADPRARGAPRQREAAGRSTAERPLRMRCPVALGLPLLCQLRQADLSREPALSDDAARRTLPCPRCSSAFEPGQEYCLECGLRLPPTSAGETRRDASFAEPRATAAWLAPALLGLVLALLGAGAAIAISSNGETKAAVPVATGGSLTAPPSTPTLTAPEPTTGTSNALPPTAAAHLLRHRAIRGRSPGLAAGAAGRSSSSRSPRTPAGPRQSPRPRRLASGDFDASASSIRRASRASTPATTSSSRASSSPRPTRQARSSGRVRSSPPPISEPSFPDRPVPLGDRTRRFRYENGKYFVTTWVLPYTRPREPLDAT